MPRFILRTWSSDEDYNADCDYGVIEITTTYARSLLKKIAIAKKLNVNSNFLSLCYADYSVDYFVDTGIFDLCEESLRNTLFEDGPAFLNNNDICELPEIFKIPDDNIQRIDVASVRINENGCSYEATPKHTNIVISTPHISHDFLKAIAKEKP